MIRYCTNIEESQRLLDAGINANTSDMTWAEGEFEPLIGRILHDADDDYWVVPAWSVLALLNIMKDTFNVELLTIDLDDKYGCGKCAIICDDDGFIGGDDLIAAIVNKIVLLSNNIKNN